MSIQSAESDYKIGIKEIDETMPNIIYPGSLLVIAGHPGIGKTTLANVICETNARAGKKCLYFSMQEVKEKHYRSMKKIGLDLDYLEYIGIYKFIHIPIITKPEDAVEYIVKLVLEWDPDIVVIDTVNALMEYMKESEVRAWLQNFFYLLSSSSNKVLILVVEMGFEEESLKAGPIEFIADSIIILKYRHYKGHVSRYMEIRKTRNTHSIVQEIPFMISEGRGIIVFPPPSLKELDKSKVKKYRFNIDIFNKYVGHILSTEQVTVFYSPKVNNLYSIVPIIDLVITNKLKTLLISFLYNKSEIIEYIASLIKKSMNDESISMDKLELYLSKYINIISMNPRERPIEDIILSIVDLAEETKADIVVLHGEDLLDSEDSDGVIQSYLTNLSYYFKNKGVPVIHLRSLTTKTDTIFNLKISSIVMEFYYNQVAGKLKEEIKVWRVGRDPAIIELNEKVLSDIRSSLRILFNELIKK